MKSTRVARRYAMAWLTEADALGVLDAVSKDVDLLEKMIGASRDFRVFLSSPVISAAKKSAVVRDLLGNRVSAETTSFILLLMKKRREDLLPEIVEQFAAIRDERLGIVNVQVTSAVEFGGSQKDLLHKKLEKYTGKNVRMHTALDKALKGGLLIQIGDTVLDASIRHQLEMLKNRFLAGTSN